MKRSASITVALLLFYTCVQAQDTAQYDLIDLGLKLFKKQRPRAEEKKSRKVRYSLAPVSNGSAGRVSISAINLAFYLADPERTNLSTMYFYPSTNFSGRYSFVVNSSFWSFENKFNLQADFRVSSIEIDDHGLGSESPSSTQSVLDYHAIRSHLLLHRLLARYLYFGLGYYLDFYNKIKGTNYGDQVSDFEAYPYGTGSKVTSSGIVFNLLRDSRRNSINPDNGFYTNVSYQVYLPELGSTYRWNGVLGDARKYIRLSQKHRQILGLRFLYWGTFGDSPYLDLPATFTDREARLGRGYFFARFRGSQLLYGETEYRFNLSRNGLWGGVVFANVQAYTKKQGDPFVGYDPSAGFGFRVKFNKQSNANLTVDFGFGRNSFNWHVNLGEFF